MMTSVVQIMLKVFIRLQQNNPLSNFEQELPETEISGSFAAR